MNNLSNLVVYNDGELELKVSVDSETVWLNRNQLSELLSECANKRTGLSFGVERHFVALQKLHCLRNFKNFCKWNLNLSESGERQSADASTRQKHLRTVECEPLFG